MKLTMALLSFSIPAFLILSADVFVEQASGLPPAQVNSSKVPDELVKLKTTAGSGLDELEKLVKEKENRKVEEDKIRKEEARKREELNTLKKAEFNADLVKFGRILLSEQSTDEINSMAWSALAGKWKITVKPDGYKTHNLIWDDNAIAPLLVEGKSIPVPPSRASGPGGYLIVDLQSGVVEELTTVSGSIFTDDVYKTAKLVMRRIFAGDLMMGAPDSDYDRSEDETQHKVSLTKDFSIGVFEVTQGQWETVMGATPSYFKNAGKTAPVEHVSWDDCHEFIRRLNTKVSGGGFRLPTEAEWEFACRAGTSTRFFAGDSESDLSAMGWYCENSGVSYRGGVDLRQYEWVKDKTTKSSGTHPVGQKRPNSWGLYDMHGNVWEWCSDWFGDYPVTESTDPCGAVTGSSRVNRGGGWGGDIRYCRSADRDWNPPGERWSYLGFRLVKSSPQ